MGLAEPWRTTGRTGSRSHHLSAAYLTFVAFREVSDSACEAPHAAPWPAASAWKYVPGPCLIFLASKSRGVYPKYE